MKLDFGGAIKKALDKTTADDEIVKDIGELLKRTEHPTDGQLEAITRAAIQAHGLMGVIEAAIIDEVVRAAKPAEPAAAK